MHVVPLAQTSGGKVLIATPSTQRALAVTPLASICVPEIQVAREFRARIGERLMLAASRIRIDAILARIDHGERRGDHETFAQRAVTVRNHEQTRDARVCR